MSIQVLYFGATADAAETKQMDLDFSGSVGDLVAHLSQRHPQLSRHKLLFSVNEQYADKEALIRDGDEVAIFTPVSGG